MQVTVLLPPSLFLAPFLSAISVPFLISFDEPSRPPSLLCLPLLFYCPFSSILSLYEIIIICSSGTLPRTLPPVIVCCLLLLLLLRPLLPLPSHTLSLSLYMQPKEKNNLPFLLLFFPQPFLSSSPLSLPPCPPSYLLTNKYTPPSPARWSRARSTHTPATRTDAHTRSTSTHPVESEW